MKKKMTATIVITTLPSVRSLPLIIPRWVTAIDPHLHSSSEPVPSSTISLRINEIGGRGGIRTHGGLPHARFRVECLKPDSATLPKSKNKRQRPRSNIEPAKQRSF